ncbi:hypothetical protein BDZ97DRAFT_1815337 [Flammula alnicola]|nr:hypothetical protein BDZ97DRAFT_1815337 [Flammula alnicola]
MSYTSADHEPSGRLSNAMARLGRSRAIRDCRTYYRVALFAMSIVTGHLSECPRSHTVNDQVRHVRFRIFLTHDLSLRCPGSLDSLLNKIQQHARIRPLVDLRTDTYNWVFYYRVFNVFSSLRRLFSAPLRACLAMNTKNFLGNFRCQVVLIMDTISWIAPFSMLIAAWVVYFSAVSATGEHPLSRSSQVTRRVWRHVNVAEVNEPQGEVSLP